MAPEEGWEMPRNRLRLKGYRTMAASKPSSSLQKAAASESLKRGRFESTFDNLLLSELVPASSSSKPASSTTSASAQLLQIKQAESQKRQQQQEEEANFQRTVLERREKIKARAAASNQLASQNEASSIVVNALVGMHRSDKERFEESGRGGGGAAAAAVRRAMKHDSTSRRNFRKQQGTKSNSIAARKPSDGKSTTKFATKASLGRRTKF